MAKRKESITANSLMGLPAMEFDGGVVTSEATCFEGQSLPWCHVHQNWVLDVTLTNCVTLHSDLTSVAFDFFI